MGIMKHKSKKSKKFDTDDINLDKKDDGYDIDASDDEMDEVPSKWYDEFPYEKLPKLPFDDNLAESLRNEAELVLDEETRSFKAFLAENKKSEMKWMMTVARSGTSTDKVAALALMVQESPVHNISALSSLVNMARVSKKHQFIVVLETLSELFISDLLRPTKKLRKFTKQPLAHLADLCKDNASRRKKLCYWLFEDKLKDLYEQFIKLLNDAAHDSVQSNREKAVGALLKLLHGNREQEQLIISNLINKFGDPVHKVASRVVYGLEKVIAKYPKKKEDILDEVERMLFRPHIAKRAQYYGICFLSQYRLSGSEKDLCKRLIVLYFSFFKSCVKTGDIDTKLMGALLVGVNRAYPYASRGKSSEPVIPDEHIDTMYKIVHLASFKISLQALALLLQISNNDRFYNALYKKLFDKELISTAHQAIWLNLMMKAIRKDTNENRRKSFVKRILQICQYFPVPLICGVLVMLSQIVKQIENINENLKFPDELEIKDEAEEADSELLSNLKRFEDNDEDEKYDDVKTEEELAEAEKAPKPEPSTSVGSSWFHRNISAPKIGKPLVEKKYKDPVSFDPLHRNPAFAGGEKSVLVELYSLSKHFHPTVSLFAKKIINGERIHYSGDPLKDFTVLHFLERFSFKNPKKSKHDRGEDKEELFRAVGSQRKHYNPTGMKALPIQSDLYLNQAESAIPPDEMFLYKYLKERRVKKDTDKRKRDDDSDLSDAESVDSVEFNDYLDNMMTGKKGADSLDFAVDIESTKTIKKNTKKDEESSSDDDDESEQELDIDEENNEDEEDVDDEEGSDVEADEDEISDFEDNIDISADDDDDADETLDLETALKKRISRDFGSMVVPTEKFSEMLEEAGRSKSGGSHDIFNRDNASEKQLKWESKRTNQNWKNKKNFGKKENWKKNKRGKK